MALQLRKILRSRSLTILACWSLITIGIGVLWVRGYMASDQIYLSSQRLLFTNGVSQETTRWQVDGLLLTKHQTDIQTISVLIKYIMASGGGICIWTIRDSYQMTGNCYGWPLYLQHVKYSAWEELRPI
jgi:hypothetical protein